jgi:hypothetical protein
MAQPVPIDMEDGTMEEQEDERNGHAGDPKPLQQDASVQNDGTGNSSVASSDTGSKKPHVTSHL